MLHKILRASNKVWNAMYYDELVETQEYQISYLKDADRLYFNCAHALITSDDQTLNLIETYFMERGVNPAFYLDSENPKDLEQKLRDRRYVDISEEEENWYVRDCSASLLQKYEDQVATFQAQNPGLETCIFAPCESQDLFDTFLKIDGDVNEITPPVLEKLRHNLLEPKDSDVQFLCALACENGEPVSVGLMGITQGMAFLSEDATRPQFRQRGFHNWVCLKRSISALKLGASHIIVNCDGNSYSNRSYQRLGFTKLFSRQYFNQQNLDHKGSI